MPWRCPKATFDYYGKGVAQAKSVAVFFDYREFRMRHQLINVQLIIVQPGLGQHPIMLHVAAPHAQAVVERPADQLAFEHLRAGFDASFEGLLRRAPALVGQGHLPTPGRA